MPRIKCSQEYCAETYEYTDDEYTILAVFRGTIIGRIARLTIPPRQNCFFETLDGRFLHLPNEKIQRLQQIHTKGHITFREYDYTLHYQKAKERSDEEPVKMDALIAKDDKIILITGLHPHIENLRNLCLGETYEFHGNEEYHACNHCKENACD